MRRGDCKQCQRPRCLRLLSWFYKRIFAELFVGKMLVRKHGDEIERFRSGIAESVRHTCRNTRHIRPFHRKTPIADHSTRPVALGVGRCDAGALS